MSLTINFCETIGGVAVSPQPTGFKGNITNSGQSTAGMRYICAFGDHTTLLTALLEAYVTAGYAVGMQHPNYSGLFADSISVTTMATTADSMGLAVLDVSYKPLEFDPASPATVYEDDISLSGEVVPLLKNSVSFADGTQVPNDADFLLQYLNYKRTLKNVTTVNLTAVIACQNKTNSGAMTLHVGTANSYSIPSEHVVYMGIDNIKINYTHSGSQRFDVTHGFLISPVNVNYQYNPNHTPTTDTVVDWFEEVTPKKYDLANMSTLGI